MTTATVPTLQAPPPQGPAFARRLRDYVHADGPMEHTMRPEYVRFDDGIGELARMFAVRYGYPSKPQDAPDEWARGLFEALWEVGREAAIEAMIVEAGEWLANRADVELGGAHR